MLAALHTDMVSASSAATVTSLWRTWCEFHCAWFASDVPELPLTGEKVKCVAACFKEGGYKGFENYASRAKEMHILEGHEWSVLLDKTVRKVSLSVSRGHWACKAVGPA